VARDGRLSPEDLARRGEGGLRNWLKASFRLAAGKPSWSKFTSRASEIKSKHRDTSSHEIFFLHLGVKFRSLRPPLPLVPPSEAQLDFELRS